MVDMQIFGLHDERPKLATLRRSELEKAAEHFGIEYDNAKDGAYILQRKLSHLDEVDVLRFLGRHDLMPEAVAEDDLRAQMQRQERQIAELTGMLMRAGIAQPAPETDDTVRSSKPVKLAYEDMSIQQLRTEVKERGLEQAPSDKAQDLVDRLNEHDASGGAE